MQCFIIGAGSDESQNSLASLMQELGLAVETSPDLKQLRADRAFIAAKQPLVVIPETASRPLDLDAIIAFANEESGRAFVVCVAETIAPSDYKRLVRTGAAEWIGWRDLREEFSELIARINASPPPERAAKIIAFLPSKGGVGNTTVVVEMAFHLASRHKRNGTRIAILDLNLQGGTVADALDIEPRFDVGEIVDRPERLDEQLVDFFTSRFSKSLDVFACPVSRLDPGSVRPEIVFTFIDAIASRYDVILFDLPAQNLPWTDNLLQGSDAVLVVGGDSVPALRKLAVTANHLDEIAIADSKVAVLVNPIEVDIMGRASRRGVIDRALARRRTFFIRRDNATTSSALDVGRPLLDLAPNSRISRDLKRVAEWIETIADHSPSPQAKSSSRRPQGTAK